MVYKIYISLSVMKNSYGEQAKKFTAQVFHLSKLIHPNCFFSLLIFYEEHFTVVRFQSQIKIVTFYWTLSVYLFHLWLAEAPFSFSFQAIYVEQVHKTISRGDLSYCAPFGILRTLPRWRWLKWRFCLFSQ